MLVSYLKLVAVTVLLRLPCFVAEGEPHGSSYLPSIQGLTSQWSDFDIKEHVFTGSWNNHTYRATVWLRLLCTEDPLRPLARFVVSLNYANKIHIDSAGYHAITPETLADSKTGLPQIYLEPVPITGEDSRVTIEGHDWNSYIKEGGWLSSVLAGKAALNSSQFYNLHMEGSEHSFSVRTFSCSPPHTFFKGARVWLGMVENMVKNRQTDAFSFLLMDHLQYHVRLGFQGTILVCAPETAAVLLTNHTVKAAVESKKLVLIVWDTALIRSRHLIMQVPGNNLLKLAMAGSPSLLGLWDLDEYLVLPGRNPITYEVAEGCMKQVQDPREYEQVISFSFAQDKSTSEPLIGSWLQHGGMLEAVKHGKYTSRMYKHCNHGVLCKAIINPNIDNQMHVHQVARAENSDQIRKFTNPGCAYIHHFFDMWIKRKFWSSNVFGEEVPLKLEDLWQP